MRKSQYTIAVECDGDEYLLYNTANGAFAALDDGAFDDFERCEGPCAASLAEDGFITTLTAAEELAAQKAIFDEQRAEASELVLVLAPTYACNLRCPYCYEQGHNAIKGKMDADVQDAILRFVKARFADDSFEALSVQWYGGDPSLALDVVEGLSERLIAWCDERQVSYAATMLTNCNAIDEAAVQMLVRARVRSVYVTIDGFSDMHNARRVSAAGRDSYALTMQAVKLFSQYGIAVQAAMNVDRVNWPEYHPLRALLREEVGCDLSCARLCDYGHFFGTRAFKKPAFDLFTHEEFSRLSHEEFVKGGFDAATLREMLKPVSRFCRGQRHAYYVIDTIGDVYLCDGVIGEADHVVFNVKDDPSPDLLQLVSHDPHDDAQCRACKLLPLCQGNCDWERRATGMQCHPLLTTMSDYLRDYRSCFGEREGAYQRFA